MRAVLVLKERLALDEDRFVDMTIWRLPAPAPGSGHEFKYRLAFVVNETCVLRFDNEAGKGDHLHVNEREVPYRFTTLVQLVDDFWQAVNDWRPR